MASKISVKVVGSGGIQSPGRNWFLTKSQKFLISTRFSSLSHTFVCKLANLLLMASRFSRINTEDLLMFSIGETANNGSLALMGRLCRLNIRKRSKKFSTKIKKDLGMACHIPPPEKKQRNKGKSHYPALVPSRFKDVDIHSAYIMNRKALSYSYY